ncbi:ABC transporter ATP-binding protein/permease [Advenella mimigardefordensis]|uniref:Putative ABC transporter permease/ATP-binding protein n=1 Tax=Advenella mimigardefordensis (strain DSM 17166 / LMG 22922 / DPN7) TaxID=1247726 RepID=W0PDW9_ADVMD|nr:ATP-binding cassette domain-containing protein [Advenella mimigardefordensis]AHG64966.1 putative ABC transporter permease/ATP-binding protein [Advenella mimigardefordensis DPN7]
MYFDYRLWLMTAGLRGRLAGGVGLGLLALLAGIARYVFLGQLLARVFDQQPWQQWLTPALLAVAMVLLRAWLDHLRTVQANQSAARIQLMLRAGLYDRIVDLGPAWLGSQRTGGVMLTVIDGVEQLQTFFGRYLPQVAISLIAPIAIFAVIAFWDVPTALVLLISALFSLLAPAAVHAMDRRASQERSQALGAFGEDFLDAMQGLPTLKAFGQGKSFGQRLAARARRLSDKTFWVLSVSVLTRGMSDLGVALGAALAITLGASRVVQGEMSLEALLIVLMAGTEIFRPLRDLRSVLHQGMLGQSAAAGIHALNDADRVVTASERAISPADLEPRIRFDNVCFAYQPERAAHNGLSFDIAAGERIGVVGPSGAGKSTIVRLLLREVMPQNGHISVGGYDIRDLSEDALLSRIALVSQDITLFHGTLDDNIRLGRPDATPEQVRAAARSANIDAFIMALPDGYETQVGDRGLQLSGGQRQRIGIARALLRDAPILILDEALSSVDSQNEFLIQEALDRLMVGRTTLILAHRLASVINADRILVLDHGRVVESGSHEVLMQQQGLYYQLMREQVGNSHIPKDADARAESVAPASSTNGPAPRSLEDDAARVGWKDVLVTLMSVVKPWRLTLVATILLGVARVAAFIGVGALSALVVAALRNGQPTQTLIIALLVVAPLAALFHWLESWLAHAMAYKLLANMRIDLYDKLEQLAPAYLLERRSGDLVSLATQDVEMIEYFYAHTIAPAIVSVLVPATVLGFLAVYSWPVALALLPFLAYALLSPVRSRRRIDALGEQARQSLGEMSAHLTDTIQGMADLTAFQATARRRKQFLDIAQSYSGQRQAILNDLSAQSAWFEVAMGLGGLAVAVTGALLANAGTLDPTMVPLLVLVAVATFLPVSEISQVSRQLADTVAASRRLHVVHQEPVPVGDGPSRLAPASQGLSIEFDQVSFRYTPTSRLTLDALTFSLAPGTTTALVGASGAGKSTIASLLLRFWDASTGTIRIGGTDIRQLELDNLREHVALVTQDTYLFNDTLAANIRLARPDASDAEVNNALASAALSGFVASLPQGLDTLVGERGTQLSGGQRQRIAIARAFLKNAPILILDEATSHLDSLSEMQVRDALALLMRERTSLIIAHRLSTIRDADQILVLDDGKLIEQGTHDTLLSRYGAYARLIQHQEQGISS